MPQRHVVLSIPKILRRYFLYDRKLLSELSRCGWEALKAFFTTITRDQKAISGAVVAIQTFGLRLVESTAWREGRACAKKILRHLGLWEVKLKPLPRANGSPLIPDAYPTPSVDDYVIDPNTPVEAYF